MSGLETAIRNALERSDRVNREVRARIYQSARQALDAGLRKQGVSDRLTIMQQQELLERKIQEIEAEELKRLEQPAPMPVVEFDTRLPYDPEPQRVDPPVQTTAASGPARREPEVMLDGETRSATTAPAASTAPPVEAAAAAPMGSSGDLGGLGAARAERLEAVPAAKPAKAAKAKKAPAPPSGTTLDVPPERAAKPRRRRGFLSHLMTWLITLAVVGGACWWFYQSGMVQSFIEEAMKAADRATAAGSGERPIAFDPRSGFSDDWAEIFVPSRAAELKPGNQAQVEAVAGAEGQAVRIVSATPGEGGDVAIDVPPEVLREMAGKSSTVALTLQSAQDSSVQLSVRCDFGSLGNCSRHRFTATQEKQDVLFRVTFERSLAPNSPGRLIVNSGLDGADRPVLLYSVRILPGQ
ncbi:hypothetical protein J2046_000214 [Rhizobium petrolearium]|uniref:hypothetical protein n=1 Tax=Neorhizobium petrolearium TaxID=515361 RepID=UPI001AE50911|nr:hypothetical protein [Neorhizobium petrolearium]MBP1841970.1 hypothetical protein [Neorhizobium petrolearium]